MLRGRLAYLNGLGDIERLTYILEHQDDLNRRMYTNVRPIELTEALMSAADILPEGKSKRALEYVVRNERAEFHFGGTDAVGPAIREAIVLLSKQKAA